MGTSFTDYRGRGFWARDSVLELWLFVLSLEIDGASQTPPWLLNARDDWRLQATVGFQGCVSASLDEHLGDDTSRVSLLLCVAASARRRLLDYGPVVPRRVLNSFGLGGGGTFQADLDPAVVLPVAEAFTALLQGEIVWDPSTSPVL